jgi:hypothetical protein
VEHVHGGLGSARGHRFPRPLNDADCFTIFFYRLRLELSIFQNLYLAVFSLMQGHCSQSYVVYCCVFCTYSCNILGPTEHVPRNNKPPIKLMNACTEASSLGVIYRDLSQNVAMEPINELR